MGLLDLTGFKGYPLVNVYIAMENHHFSWENPLFLWPFSIAMLNYQRVFMEKNGVFFWLDVGGLEDLQ